MMPATEQSRPKSPQRRKAGQILLAATALAGSFLGGGSLEGFRINTTPSQPLGLWRIVTLDRPPVVGDLVFICPPDNEVMRAARSRG